jgi:C_GCAxxG_C_C family probable redox protein
LEDHPDPARIRKIAEEYYRVGDFYCSEAIVKAIKDEFQLEVPEIVVAMASGLPVGIGGSGCVCGAVTGGVLALGMLFGRTAAGDPAVEKVMALAGELHDAFRSNRRKLCCRVLTKKTPLGSPEHMEQCISFTGEVAENVAKIILREKPEILQA